MTTVAELFERSNATVCFDDGSTWTAQALLDRARRWATALRELGIRHGDRVAIRLPNGPEYVTLLVACAVGGQVAVSVNTRFSEAEAESLVRRSGASTVTPRPEWDDREVSPDIGGADDRFVVFTTSGTTSRPKMVVHDQRSIAVHARDAAAACTYRRDDNVLAVMPLCGTFGLAAFTAAVAGAGTIVVTDYELDRTVALIEAHRVTSVHGSDDLFHRLIDRGADLRSIRIGGYARFNTSLDGLVVRAERAGATLTGLYGMSEVQALFAVRDVTGAAADRARPGGTLVSPAASYRVVDDELHVRGPSLMLGYLAEGGEEIDAALTADHTIDGWFRTGDVAVAEGGRTFEYVTRRGDAMRLGGFLVDPSEVESVLCAQPGVVAAQVVAVDRPTGARPVAFVIGEDADEQALIEACADRLATYKVPVHVEIVDAFPTTDGPNGVKIQRAELRRLGDRLI